MALKHFEPKLNEGYSKRLPEVYKKIPKDEITLRELLKLIGGPGKLLLSMLLAVPFLIPISIPGTGIIAGVIIFTIAISLIFDRDLIPNRIMKTKISNENLTKALNTTSRVLTFLEKYIKPRLLVMNSGSITPKLNKIAFLICSILFFLPLPIPLTDTLPASGIILLAAGILESDGYLILAAYSIVFITMIYFGAAILIGWMAISSGSLHFP
jgi:hypothetical protein